MKREMTRAAQPALCRHEDRRLTGEAWPRPFGVMNLNRESPQKWLVDINPHVNDVHHRVPN